MEKKVPERKVRLREEDIFYVYDKRINKCIKEDCEGTVKYGLVLKVSVTDTETCNCFECNKCHMKYTPYPNYVRLTKTDMLSIRNQEEVTARDKKRAEDAVKQAAKERREAAAKSGYGKPSYGKRPFAKKPFPDTKDGDPRSSDRRPYEKKSYEKKPYEAKSYEQRPYEKKTYERKPYEKKMYEKRPYEKKAYDNRPYSKDTSTTYDSDRRKPFVKSSYGEYRSGNQQSSGMNQSQSTEKNYKTSTGEPKKKSNIVITTGNYKRSF